MKAIVISILLCSLCVKAQQRQPVVQMQTDNLPTQKIGIDDLVGISVYDAPELTRTVRVNTDGTIRLPMLKARIKADGLLPIDLETAITDALKSEDVLVDPVVTVNLVESRSRPINVVGAVKNPLTFQASGFISLLDALSRAGGLADTAGTEILVSKAQPGEEGKTVLLTRRIPIKGLIDAADPELNIRLEGGEEIRVPDAGRFYVVGNVKKPGVFPIKDTTDSSVLKALALSEGLTAFSQKVAYIYRKEGGAQGHNEIPVELTRLMKREVPDIPLLPNDILYIPDNPKRRLTVTTLDRIATFAAGTVSGVLIYSTMRP
jgi:polysaccharide biosynthesis/export protein